MDKFIARYEQNGIKRSIAFDKSRFDQPKAEVWLKENGIKNFLFVFEPIPPKPIGENSVMLSGEVGFDITLNEVLSILESGKEIILDTFGGDAWEALKIHDAIKLLNNNPSIGVIGSCMSAGMQILLATENRWMTPNSRGLIHNPWTFEAGDDEALRNMANQLEREKMQIANIYAGISGKPIDYILDLMKKETILSSDQMVELNFVTSLRGDNLNTIVTNKNEKMTVEDEKRLGTIENMFNNIKKLFSPVKNIVLQDVNGTELDFGNAIETPEQIQVGSTATVDGSPAQGEYVMEDGTVYTFEAGAIVEIQIPAEEDPLMQENAELKAQISELESQLSTAQNAADQLEVANNAIKDEFLKVQNAFVAFKNEFSKEKQEITVPSEDVNGEQKTKFTFKRK